MMTQLLASAGTIEGIEMQIRRFWHSDEYTVDPETLAIQHPERKVNPSVRVVRKGKRYRFEMVA